jgi:hypothetical protein
VYDLQECRRRLSTACHSDREGPPSIMLQLRSPVLGEKGISDTFVTHFSVNCYLAESYRSAGFVLVGQIA